MKKLFIVSVLLLSIAGYSQTANKDLRTSKEYKKEVSVLKLSSEQEAQYFQLTNKYVGLNDELMEMNIPSSEVVKKQDALEEKKYAEMQQLLSEEQFTTYKKLAADKIAAARNLKKY
ncbi:hypothetical protein [Flavobacterium sp. GCM10027622]|uniref:hypothetical protein n=1 Tax=unclassified Flavobacterium TaxID=196869 RepID=UPI0036189C11